MQKRKSILTNTPDTYPMRINKYLAHKGIATRAGVDELIKHQKVLINGKVAKLGDKIEKTDKVEVWGKHTKKQYVYFAYNKPKNIVTVNPQGTEKDILQNIKSDTNIFPIGRLDKESHGLILLTNDGRLTDRLLNPKNDHEKEYVVEVDRKFTPAFIKHMQEGVLIGGEITKPAIVKRLSDKIFSITLTEGKNHQIKRMTEKLGYTVRDLQRIRIQNIELGNLATNMQREVKDEELLTFLKTIGL